MLSFLLAAHFCQGKGYLLQAVWNDCVDPDIAIARTHLRFYSVFARSPLSLPQTPFSLSPFVIRGIPIQ